MLRNLSKTITKLRSRRLWLGFYLAPTIAAFSIALVMLPGIRPQGIDSIANSSADVVIGQPDMNSNLINQVGYGKTLYHPARMCYDGAKFYAADQYNNRVLIYDSLPTSNDDIPSVVLGQPDLLSNAANNGGVSARSLSHPSAVFSDGTRLVVCDQDNNRVLVYNSIPTAAFAPADIVIGQPDMTSNSINAGSGTSCNAKTFHYPNSAVISGGKLLIGDWYNNRGLIYNSIPTSNYAPADIAVGQPDLTTNSAGCAANKCRRVVNLVINSGKLFVCDYENNRVLIFNSVPLANNASADIVIGQPDFNTNTVDKTSNKWLEYPVETVFAGSRMAIVQTVGNRVSIYNNIPTSDNPDADVIIGQPDFNSDTANNGGLSANTLYTPAGLVTDGTKLYISDADNHRVLIFNSWPDSTYKAADNVLGQPDMTSNSINQSAVAISGITVYSPTGVFKYGSKLFISDQNNNRVLIYNSVPSDDNALPDLVIGQPDMTTNEANSGGLSAKTLKQPRAVFYDGTHLVIPDYGNHRVLVYNGLPTSNFAAADVVIGQPDMDSNTANSGGVSGKSLRQPIAVFVYGGKLLVSDNYNSRVLIFNTIPVSNFAEADTVIGQPDMTSNTGNNGGISARSLLHMSRIFVSDNKLFVSDYENNRVLVYNSIPTSNFAAADTVIGQPDMNSNSANQGGAVSAAVLNRPAGLWVEGPRLYVADQHNNRVLIFNTVPTANNAAADVVVGQPDMSESSINQGYNLSSKTLYYPTGLYCDSESLYVSDYLNNRVLIYDLNTTKPVISDVKINEAGVVSGDTINSIPVLKAKLSGSDTVGGVYINNLKITLGSTLYTYASFDASTDSYNSTTGIFTFKVKSELVPGKYDLKIEVSDYLGNWATYEATDLEVRAGSEAEIIGAPLNYPNPFNTTTGTTKITYNLTVDSNIFVYIFDVRGALVWKRSYSTGSMGGKAGYNEVEWDGKDDFGSTVGNGIYPFRIVAGAKVLGRGKIAVLD